MCSCTAGQAFTLTGFPHSDICGSVDICSSPQLFAACHVLHRLQSPRHSPCALCNLTFFWFSRRSSLTHNSWMIKSLSYYKLKAFRFYSLFLMLVNRCCTSPKQYTALLLSCLIFHVRSSMQFSRSKSHLPIRCAACAGGDNEIRTRDLLRARQALSQLSYIPG